MKMDMTKVLPEDCINNIISFTSPKDACRSSVVSQSFKATADSDAVWGRFLPSDYSDIIDQSSPAWNSLPKKQIYLHLCDHPLLLDNGYMALSLEKASGRKCCMIGAKGLTVIWGDTPGYWQWKSITASRFPQVAVLNLVWWLEVKGSLETKFLSPDTTYAVYFIFKIPRNNHTFKDKYVNLSVNEGGINYSHKRVILEPPGEGVLQREDGWMEIEMGEFFNEYAKDGFVDYRFWETDCSFVKSGIIVEGVEFRPRSW